MKAKDKLTLEEANKLIYRHTGSFSCLVGLLSLSYANHLGGPGHWLEQRDWLTLLGQHWSSCDNVWEYTKELKYALFLNATPCTVPEMMNDSERQALAALPDTVTIYRGCGPLNMKGCCWTLDRNIAEEFTVMGRYEQREPLLITATVKRNRIVALKLDRDEQEVLTFNAKRVSVDPLSAEDQQRALDRVGERSQRDHAEFMAELDKNKARLAAQSIAQK
ncbi:hypothetical protein [Paraburkholderia sp. GAS348]|uniref:hypothetical protein n=1 Tax=Paraburkholderia sp. GAS348 TaxID=3035132 RepID=UPI003D1AE944